MDGRSSRKVRGLFWVWDYLLTCKGRHIYVPDFFRDSVTDADVFGV